jgi:hypothetical protein
MRIAVLFLSMFACAGTSAAQTVAAANVAPSSAAPPAADNSGYTYHAEGRRDPFVSLMRRAPDIQRQPSGLRSTGLAGLTIGEVALKGILRAPDGYIGIVLGADQRSYIVRPGDRLLDGTVRGIAADSLVIAQQVVVGGERRLQRSRVAGVDADRLHAEPRDRRARGQPLGAGRGDARRVGTGLVGIQELLLRVRVLVPPGPVQQPGAVDQLAVLGDPRLHVLNLEEEVGIG